MRLRDHSTMQRRIGELLAGQGFLDGWTLDFEITRLLNEMVACGYVTHDKVDWATLESRRQSLEGWKSWKWSPLE